jgi:hypothetical protein
MTDLGTTTALESPQVNQRCETAHRPSGFPILALGILTLAAINIAVPSHPDRSIWDEANAAIQAHMDQDYANGVRFKNDPLNDCESYPDLPCVVYNNYGGYLVVFEFAARTLPARTHRDVAILGECASACTVFADEARDRICVGPGTVMAFHRSNQDEVPSSYRRELVSWVEAHGGFPSFESGDVTEMHFPVTLTFWRLCKPKDFLIEPEAHLR